MKIFSQLKLLALIPCAQYVGNNERVLLSDPVEWNAAAVTNPTAGLHKSYTTSTQYAQPSDWIRLWVFPEGTRNQKGDILPFKKGAFHLAVQAQAPIIPMVFSSYSNFYLRKEKEFKSGTITLKILPKIDTKGLTSADVSSLCDQSYALMRSTFLEISGQPPQSNGPSNH